MGISKKYPVEDIDEILDISAGAIMGLAGAKLAIFGGTGFIGSWLIQTLVEANHRWQSEIDITVFTRSVPKARSRFHFIGSQFLSFQEIDFKDSDLVHPQLFDFYIGGATPSAAATGLSDENLVWQSTVNSSRLIVENSRHFQNVPRVLNLSSGAVYGKFFIDPKTELKYHCRADSVYAKAKLESERILNVARSNRLVSLANARLFSFLGPGIRLDQHFAVGQFMHNILLGKRITLNGNCKTVRTYMYPTDLISSLISLLISSNEITCNIGSRNEMQMRHIVERFALIGAVDFDVVGNPDMPINIYSPLSTDHSVNFPVNNTVDIDSGIRRWLQWHQTN
jgi:dTDP-glucose 4,6-dehydratase